MAMLTSLSPEDLIPGDHPIRQIRRVVEVVVDELDGELEAMYSLVGRLSVPPEQLLKGHRADGVVVGAQRVGVPGNISKSRNCR